MQFASLGSGSEGNGTLVRSNAGARSLLVDCGFSMKETINRLAALDAQIQDVEAILVTHEHSDHVKGVARLANRYRIPVYCTWGTWREKLAGTLDEALYKQIAPDQQWAVAELAIQAIPVPHDAREPCQFVFNSAGIRLGLLTDVGSITQHMVEQYQGCDGLMLEFNHDLHMLQEGPYPSSLKRRVAGPLGHLNNLQALDLLRQVIDDRLQHVVATHISQKNNDPDLVKEAISAAQLGAETALTLATQADGFRWLELSGFNATYP